MAAFPLPLPLLARTHPADARAIRDWWDALPEAERAELVALWDRRDNDCRFARAADGPDPPAWHRLPLVLAEFTDDEQPGDDWRPEWFDHLLSNPDKWIVGEPPPRTPFIGCTAHPTARAALRTGFLPHDFACPLASADCPMRKLLAREPGRSVIFTVIGPG